MKRQALGFGMAVAMSSLLILSAVESEASAAPAADATPKTADGRPSLSGLWGGGMPLAFEARKSEDGSIKFGFKGGKPPAALVNPGPKSAPQYKPEFQAKLKGMQAGNLNRQDAVFSCGDPGLPRVGAPQQIVQEANQVVFLYAGFSGMVFRVIPTDGRPPHDTDPSNYGVGAGRWDGDTLVVETGNLSTDTWMGGDGYFHSDKMRVIERFRRVGETLEYNVTVEDPEVLAQPWVKPKLVLTKASMPLEEPYPCDAEKAASAADDGPRQLLQ